jgi:predicted GNAT family N-acyltransferase
MVRFIKTEDLLPIRNEVLREGKLTPEECRFPTDEINGAFHLGYFFHDELGSVTTLFPQNYESCPGAGYQLRGMATLEQFRSKGYGRQLVDYAVEYLRNKGANYIWCNARKKAQKFYSDAGFVVISDEFEVKNIGPHYVMYLKIQ